MQPPSCERPRRAAAATLAAVVTLSAAAGAALAPSTKDDLKEWLSYIASDELEGRALYSSGLGLAAAYIEDHLRWGAKPAGDNGAYLQTVRVLGVKATRRSSVTVEVNGQTPDVCRRCGHHVSEKRRAASAG